MEKGSEVKETEQDWWKKRRVKISYNESDRVKRKTYSAIRGNTKGDKTVLKEGKKTKRRGPREMEGQTERRPQEQKTQRKLQSVGQSKENNLQCWKEKRRLARTEGRRGEDGEKDRQKVEEPKIKRKLQ